MKAKISVVITLFFFVLITTSCNKNYDDIQNTEDTNLNSGSVSTYENLISTQEKQSTIVSEVTSVTSETQTSIINQPVATECETITDNTESTYIEHQKQINTFGNTAQNLTNYGLVALQDNWIYFSHSLYDEYEKKYSLCKIKTDGTNLTKLSDDYASWIYVNKVDTKKARNYAVKAAL